MKNPPDRSLLLGSHEHTLDAKYVIEHFLGKTPGQVKSEFRNHARPYAEDFMFMGPEGLRYYLPAAFDYLRDEQNEGDCDFCSGLLCSLFSQTGQGKLPFDVLACAKDIADYCDSHREKFGLADHDELHDKYIAGIRKIAEPSGPANGSQPFRSD